MSDLMKSATFAVAVVLVASAGLMAQTPDPDPAAVRVVLGNGHPGGQPASNLLDRPAWVTLERVPLELALNRLSRASGVPLAFSPDFLPAETFTDCACEEVTVREALERILDGTDLRFVVMDRQILIEPAPRLQFQPRSIPVRLAVTQGHLAASRSQPAVSLHQSGTIEGRVTRSDIGAPLVGAQVVITATGLGSTTNSDGRYRIEDVPAGETEVRVHMIGFARGTRTVSVRANEITTADFQLGQQALGLDEIVVTGTAGGTQRRAVGNVVGRLDGAAIAEAAAVTSVRDMIGSREPGASVQGGAGAVGSGTTIRIRGTSSLSLSNDPIIYVDGVRVEGGSSRTRFGPGHNESSRLDDFSLEDIESIEIIKGPAAATLYGTEAANGVIQITTKRGSAGRPTFYSTHRIGTTWFPNPQRFSGDKWTLDGSGQPTSVNLYDHEAEFGGGPMFKYGFLQYHSLGLRGGTDLMNYNASVSWDDEQGAHVENFADRFSLRSNLDLVPRDDVDVGLSVGFVQRTVGVPAQDYVTSPLALLVFGLHPDAAPQRRGMFGSVPEEADRIRSWQDISRMSGSLGITHVPASWFTHRLTVGLDDTREEGTEFWPRHPDGSAGPYGVRSLGQRIEQTAISKNYTVDYGATGTFRVRPTIESATSLGLQYYQKQLTTRRVRGEGFASEDLTTIGAAAVTEAFADYVENKTAGFYLQEQVGFNNSLFVTGALRVDNNSAFGADFGLAVYPKLSATWTLEDDPFEFAPWVNTLRLRSAYGAAGQQPDVFAAIRLYDPVTGPGGTAAFSPSEVGNPDLKPERSEELEIGADVSLFGDRSRLEFTFYNRNTKDAIVARALPPSEGFPGIQFVNVGQVKNWGTELSLEFDAIRPTEGGLGWTLGVGLATMNNRLERLGIEGVDRISGSGVVHVEGQPLGGLYYPRVVSADLSDGQAVNRMCDGGPGNEPVPCGVAPDVRWGTANPTWELGITSTVTFGNLRFNLRGEGRGGHVLRDGNLGPRVQVTPWSKDINTRTNPMVLAYEPIREGVAFFEAGYFKLREVGLHFSLPDPWAASIGATRAAVGVEMRNVMTLWRAAEYSIVAEKYISDPEARESFYVPEPELGTLDNHWSGGHQVQWPQMQTFLTSIRLTF